MAKAARDEKANPRSGGKPQPYARSWANRFTAWVGRLPGPSWSYYLGLGLVLSIAQAIVLWVEGAFPAGTLPVHGYLAGAIALILALFHYLDERAGAALATLRPALKASEQEYSELHYRLTTLPMGSTLLASLVVLAAALLNEVFAGEPYRLEALDPFPISANLLRFVYILCWCVFGAFIYHTVHQLRLIDRIYTRHTRISLFRMKPLYAFSNLTAFTAGSLTVIPYGFLAVSPGVVINDPAVLVPVLIIQSVAVATFIWPQLGIHRLQVAEKDRLLDEVHQRLKATIVELHRRVDDGELEKMDELSGTFANLETESSILKGIPTWPWQPETVRWLVTALVLPLGLWVVQFVLQRVLGP
jgi:hypothetical protein